MNQQTDSRGRDLGRWVVPLVLTLAVLVPYWKLTLLRAVLVTDDVFVSDIFGGEFPVRVWAGATARGGEVPLWIRDVGGGMPNTMLDPITILLFAVLPPLAAMNLQLLCILLVALHGTYAYARVVGASRAGASLAGLAYAYSGFMVSQLKHVSAVSIACLFPLGLLCLERALGPRRKAPARLPARVLPLVAFAFIVGLQLLAGFPQTALYAFLGYAGYGVARVARGAGRSWRRAGRAAALLTATGGFAALGVLVGSAAPALMGDVSALSVRAGGLSLSTIQRHAYDLRAAVTFFVPYAFGDVSQKTYRLLGTPWEEYGYAGFLTACIALVTIVWRRRDPVVALLAGLLVAAFLVVLGPVLPIFPFLYEHVPGVRLFRFTTRAMFAVDFALAVLAGLGLTALEGRLRARRPAAPAPRWIAWGSVAVTLVDLVFHQMRQNAFGDARAFLDTPRNASVIAAGARGHRYFSLGHRKLHTTAHSSAHAWADLRPYALIVDALEPNTNLLWGLSSADGYSGLVLRHVVDVWGDVAQVGLIDKLMPGSPLWSRVLALNSVSHVATPFEVDPETVVPVTRGLVSVFSIPSVLPRAYVATRAHMEVANIDPAHVLLADGFTPGRDVLLADGLPGVEAEKEESGPVSSARVVVTEDRQNATALDVDSAADGVLVLTDTYFPEWVATVDGVETPIVRANINQRAIALPRGRHRVRFDLRWPMFRAMALLGVGTSLLLLALAVRIRFAMQPRRRPRALAAATAGR